MEMQDDEDGEYGTQELLKLLEAIENMTVEEYKELYARAQSRENIVDCDIASQKISIVLDSMETNEVYSNSVNTQTSQTPNEYNFINSTLLKAA